MGGQWVETKREFVGERVGTPRWVTSPPFEVDNVAGDSEQAWRRMTNQFIRDDARAEQQIAAARKACGG